MNTNIREQVANLNYWTQHYFEARQFEQAIDYARQAYDLAQAHLPIEDEFSLQAMNNLATLLQLAGDYTAAEPVLHQVVEITRETRGEQNTDFATYLNNLGLLYRHLGNYPEAMSCYRRALELRRQLLGENHMYTIQTANNLASIYYFIGDYQGAARLMEEILPLRRDYLNQMLDLMPQSGQYLPYAVGEYSDGLNNLALIYYQMNRYDQAEALLEEALQWRANVLGPEHTSVAQSLHNLASYYASIDKAEQAESNYRQALQIRTSELGEAHPDTSQTAANLAVLLVQSGDTASAEPLLRKALESRLAVLGEDHPLVVQTRYNLAALYALTDRVDLAMETLTGALRAESQITGQVFSIGSEIQRLRYLSILQPGYRLFLSLLLVFYPRVPSRVQAGLALVQQRKALAAEAFAAQRDAILVGHHPELQPELRELASLRAQIAQKYLAGPGAEGVDVYRQLLDQWSEQKEQLEAELARRIPEIRLERELSQVTPEILAEALPPGAALVEFVSLSDLPLPSQISVGQVGEPENSSRYLAFVLLAGQPVQVHLVDLGEAAVIDPLIAQFRLAITGEEEREDLAGSETSQPESGEITVRSDPGALLAAIQASRQIGSKPSKVVDSQAWLEPGSSLRKAIFDPLLPLLEGRQHLYLAPDGNLARLPFETLPYGQDRFLTDHFQISYLSVGRDLLRIKSISPVPSEKPLVVADPDYDLMLERAPGFQPGAPFRRLNGTRAEGQVTGMRLQVEPLVAGQALERRLKSGRSPRILHLATHGLFLPDTNEMNSGNTQDLFSAGELGNNRYERLKRVANPLLRSGLALAGVNSWLQGKPLPAEAEDGLLTAEDVTGLDLLGTELVVLSACDTGLGAIQAGEGVFGLRRAFAIAGARTLVMSLWKVPDEATRELMELFYANLIDKKLGRAEALRRAQLAMKDMYKHPFYWGAFICQGDPSPLQL